MRRELRYVLYSSVRGFFADKAECLATAPCSWRFTWNAGLATALTAAESQDGFNQLVEASRKRVGAVCVLLANRHYRWGGGPACCDEGPSSR